MAYLLLMSAIIFQAGMGPWGNHRTVLIFGTNKSKVEQQLQTLRKDGSGLAERDVAIHIIKPGGRLYKSYQVASAEPFTIILTGKDGSEKHRGTSILSTSRLFAMIDAMPMRQAEMRRLKNKPE